MTGLISQSNWSPLVNDNFVITSENWPKSNMIVPGNFKIHSINTNPNYKYLTDWKFQAKKIQKRNSKSLILELTWSLYFPADIYRGGASWTLNPSMEAVNFKIKLANSTFILVNVLAYNNFMWTRKGVIVDIVIWIIEIYYSLLKSHLVPQICTVSYVKYFVSSQEIIFGRALHSKKWRL